MPPTPKSKDMPVRRHANTTEVKLPAGKSVRYRGVTYGDEKRDLVLTVDRDDVPILLAAGCVTCESGYREPTPA